MEDNFSKKDKDIYMIDLHKWFLILWKRKFCIIGIVTLTVLLVVFFMSPLFITPKYKSSISFYPNNVQPKSDETSTRQVMLWCQSNNMVDSITKKYEYKKRYNIKSDNNIKLNELYKSNINVRLDKFYGNIIVDVYDIDPEIAYTIAKDFPVLLNNIIINEFKRPYTLSLDAVTKALAIKDRALDSIMKVLVAYGADYELILQTMQGAEVTKGYLGTSEGSRTVDKEALKKLKANIEQKGPMAYEVQQLFFSLVSQRNDLQARYDAIFVKLIEEMNFITVVIEPFYNPTKVYPRILRTAFVFGFISFFAAIIFFLFTELNFVRHFLDDIRRIKRKK
ncbi:MAG: hypothetical protein GX612_07185 [Bacteroidales bacterium]|nr:hypothetical protein [Bacteroidales bacterium]